MKIGIVGSEAAKFTKEGEKQAKGAILDVIKYLVPIQRMGLPINSEDAVVSGHCHLGGIDIWAEELADTLGYKKLIFPPRKLNWSEGYKPRNIQIAVNSDIVYCISVDKLPEDYKGMRFDGCYHCLRGGSTYPHIKSGGCWTVLEAIKRGKVGRWIVVNN